MYFDSHVHIGTPDPDPPEDKEAWPAYDSYHKMTPEVHMESALRHSVLHSLAFPFPFAECGIKNLNDEVIGYAQKYPYFYTPLLLNPSFSDVEQYPNIFAGVKGHFYISGNEALPDPMLMDYLQATGKVYLFHAHSHAWEKNIRYLTENFKQLKIIVAHCARHNYISALRERPSECVNEMVNWIPRDALENVFFDTSNVRNEVFISEMIKRFGASQILWGSDFPYEDNLGEDLLLCEIETIENALAGVRESDLVRSGNFKRLFLHDDILVTRMLGKDIEDLRLVLSCISRQDFLKLTLDKENASIGSIIKDASHIIVARNADMRITGFIHWRDNVGDAIVIEELYVDCDFRSCGIARKLVSNLCASFKRVEARSDVKNLPIRHVFDSLGFKSSHMPNNAIIHWQKG